MTIRKLMSTTALVAMTATAAYVASPVTFAAAAVMADGYVQTVDKGDHFASDLIGATVYGSASEDAEAIGDVNDLVLTPDGEVQAVVIGVGGFLGIGEKDVAVSFDQLTWATGSDGETWPVLKVSKEQLEAAPDFERDRDADTAMTDERPATDKMADDQMAMTEEKPAAEKMADDQTAMTETKPAAKPMDDQTAMAPAADQLKAYDTSLVSADDLIDTTVYGSDGENVGEISDVLVTDDGKIDAIVIDVGGFLGIGEKPVAIDFKDLRIAVDQNENPILQTAFTRDQLDAAPEYDEAAYRDNRDQVIVRSKS